MCFSPFSATWSSHQQICCRFQNKFEVFDNCPETIRLFIWREREKRVKKQQCRRDELTCAHNSNFRHGYVMSREWLRLRPYRIWNHNFLRDPLMWTCLFVCSFKHLSRGGLLKLDTESEFVRWKLQELKNIKMSAFIIFSIFFPHPEFCCYFIPATMNMSYLCVFLSCTRFRKILEKF